MSASGIERVVLSLLFGVSGLAKLLGLAFEAEAFARWGFPPGFMYFIGILEVAGAVGIWLPRLSPFAVLCLAGLTLGALVTRVMFMEWPAAGLTFIVLLLALHYTWRQRAELFPR